MTPEQERKIDEALKLARDNNAILKRMERREFWMRLFRIFYWIIVLGSAIGLYYILEPYVKAVKDTYTSVGERFYDLSHPFQRD